MDVFSIARGAPPLRLVGFFPVLMVWPVTGLQHATGAR